MSGSRLLKSLPVAMAFLLRGYATSKPPLPKVPCVASLSLLRSPSKLPSSFQLLRSPKQPLTPPPLPSQNSSTFQITPLTTQLLRQESPHELLIYTDASYRPLKESSSAGIYSAGIAPLSEHIALPPGLNSVQAETQALLHGIAIGLPIAHRTGRGVLTVCGDCIPALRIVGSLIDRGIFGGSGGVGAKVRVQVEWVKGHSGVKGNMAAHRLARKGAL
ncbi:hypothetical protein L873DRAFT_1809258 [Choiromyces venosus 120613-1]|uniref:Uncharacterized protein n=1 Tax=Choiromyces venosus 120613-1 TaxID=1336337 RepID=A0A3N4JHQ0_9PEZI|nr:hypothetical protein L873DRAFT_1809258 [Choiromyces venosus 120613-1]